MRSSSRQVRPGSGAVVLLALAALARAAASAPERGDDAFLDVVRPFVEHHCIDCHDAADPLGASGDVDLAGSTDAERARAAASTWTRVRSMLSRSAMPPPIVAERPHAEDVERVLAWIDATFGPPEVEGEEETTARERTSTRRLNRTEYRHAIRDLVGVDYPTDELFPVDGVAHGFDVIGEVLTTPPLLSEKLVEAAERIAHAALPTSEERAFTTRTFGASELATGEGNRFDAGHDLIAMYSNGAATASVTIATAGLYRIAARAAGQPAGPELPRMVFRDGARRVAEFEVEARGREPAEYAAEVRLEPGEHTLAAAFTNDYYRPEAEDPADRDRNLLLFSLALVGPLDVPLETAFERAYPAEVRANPRATIADLASLVWRERVDEATLDALLALTPDDADADARVRTALFALLASPRFLFLATDERASGLSGASGARDVATRLAAFLWSSVPDRALLDAADAGALDTRPGVARVVDAMFDDERASRLATSFGAQWLQLTRLRAAESRTRSPEAPGDVLDAELRDAMLAESELFFEAIRREDRPVRELLRADFTFANARLAAHYGIDGVEGDAMRRIDVPEELRGVRGGVLGQAAVLTATSHATRTSPTLRGKWVLEALLATPPPPPPPGVGALDESPTARESASLRERLDLHRTDPICAACHGRMDPLGFVLDHYDALGAWRDSDGPHPIDATGTLPDGTTLAGPSDLLARLGERTAFERALLLHLATFALGRGLRPSDEAELDSRMAVLPAAPTMRDLVRAIATSDAFLGDGEDDER